MRLLHRIEIMSMGESQDDAGQVVQEWTTYRTCSAGMRHGGSSQASRSSQQVALGTTAFTIRAPGDGRAPTSRDRIRHTAASVTTIYEIGGVEPMDDRGRWLRLDTTRVEA